MSATDESYICWCSTIRCGQNPEPVGGLLYSRIVLVHRNRRQSLGREDAGSVRFFSSTGGVRSAARPRGVVRRVASFGQQRPRNRHSLRRVRPDLVSRCFSRASWGIFCWEVMCIRGVHDLAWCSSRLRRDCIVIVIEGLPASTRAERARDRRRSGACVST